MARSKSGKTPTPPTNTTQARRRASSAKRPAVAKKWIRNASDEIAIKAGCYFDLAAAEYVRGFIEGFCKQSIGDWQGQKLELLPWQWNDLVAPLYGWKQADGRRRFKSSYTQTGKKNGKSTLISALDLYHLIGDGEAVPYIINLGCDTYHASQIYEECERMVQASPDLQSRVELTPSEGLIACPGNYGKIVTASKVVESKEGRNVSLVIFDDLHRQATDKLWRVMRYAGSARRQFLRIAISNAGTSDDVERKSICYRQYTYSKGVLDGTIEDITHHAAIFEPEDPQNADVDDPKTWQAANPSLGHTIDIGTFRSDLVEAKADPDQLAEFKQLRLSIWVANRRRFLRKDLWDACGEPFDLSLIEGLPCYAGLDLATSTDLASLAIVVPLDKLVYAAWLHWCPTGRALARDKERIPYTAWARDGFISLVEGDILDYDQVIADAVAFLSRFQLQKLKIDPYNASQIALELRDDHGLPVDFIRQGFLSLSGPTKEVERLTTGVLLRHGNNPCVNWQAGNAVVRRDPAGNIKFDKEKSSNKIDGLAALVNAVAGLIGETDDTDSCYETERLLIL